MRTFLSFLATLLGLIHTAIPGQPDLVLADFEGTNYGNWAVEGEAFGTSPAQGTLPHQMAVSGFLGKGLANSFHGGDRTTGTLRSPEFVISRKYLKFLIGGGGWHSNTCLQLVVEGKVLRTASGTNTQPGGSEELSPASWDVSQLRGKKARLEIVDRATSGWGHINVDQIVLSDAPSPVLTQGARQMIVRKRYLNFPVRNDAPLRRVKVAVGDLDEEFDIELAETEPEFWVAVDLGPYRGATATITVNKISADCSGLPFLRLENKLIGSKSLYREPLRPQFHFSPKRGWNNDPNGLVFYQGEYHLYFQHNPYGTKWGNMHWGHAISPDLVHWQELPIALYPKRYDDWAFSGSAVVDWDNTAGFQQGGEQAIVAAYTSTGRGECIVYSRDRGRTFQEYSGNPVVKHRGRDPRLLWHAPSSQWVMAVYDEQEERSDSREKQGIAFYTSKDLKQWNLRSRIGGFYECPDLFALKLDGKTEKWILTAANSEYMVGEFDGAEFHPETPKLPGHAGQGHDFYAAQTYNDPRRGDNRVIQIGWCRFPSPGMPFSQMMSFPCELGLRSTVAGPRLTWWPTSEIRALWGKQKRMRDETLTPGGKPLIFKAADCVDLELDAAADQQSELHLALSGVDLRYDFGRGELTCQKITRKLSTANGHLRLRLLADRTSVEVFADDGVLFMPLPRSLNQVSNQPISIAAHGAPIQIRSFVAREMRSAWR